MKYSEDFRFRAAYNLALAMESIPDELTGIDRDLLETYARMVAYKTYHNIIRGRPMLMDYDPTSEGIE